MVVYQYEKLWKCRNMQVLWVHDHIFHVTPLADVYSAGKFPYAIWNRYLSEFNTLHIVGRCQHIVEQSDFSKLTLSSGRNVRFTFVPSLSNPKSFLFYRRNVSRKIRELVRDVDAVIARLPSLNGELAVRAALAEGKPYAVEMVGCPWDSFWNYGNWQGRIMAPRAYLTTKCIVRKSPYAIYVSRKFLQKRYPCKGHTAAVSNVFIPSTNKTVLRHRLERIRYNRPVIIGLIGDLCTKYKGIQVAIKALSIVAKMFPELRLKVLGTGDQYPWIALARKNNVSRYLEFCGTLPNGQAVFEWLDTVDLYIQPSFQEGLPRALVEAMSRACPALGSTAGGIPELLSLECLHKPGDYRKLSEDILKACRNTDWRRQQAKRNFKLAKDYRQEVLDIKRWQFWRDFAGFVCCKKNEQ